MKTLGSVAAITFALLSATTAAGPNDAGDQQLLASVKELQAQQAQIAANQAKIEAKLATVTEAVRVARIYSSRAGH